MSNRIPEDAFSYYASLGASRSYRQVADRYGVSKRAVTKYAKRERWPERIREAEAKARAEADKKVAESLEEMQTRNLKLVRLMAARALEALQRHPLANGMEGARAGQLAVKLHRILMGEPSERVAVSIEEVTRREIKELLTTEDDDGGEDDSW